MRYVKTIMSSAKARSATRRLRSGSGIAPKVEGLSEAVLQRPSKHRMKIIADKAEPWVVPRKIGNDEECPLLIIIAPFRLHIMLIIKSSIIWGVLIFSRMHRIYWKEILSKAFLKSSLRAITSGLGSDRDWSMISETILEMFSALRPCK